MSQKRVKPHIYEGQNLLQIAMPLGGIGTGCLSMNGYGGLQDFSIHHAPTLSAMPDRHLPQDAGFALLHLPGSGQTRLLEGPFPPEKLYNLGLKSQGYNGGGFEGLPRLRHCAFQGSYPFGTARLSDPDVPLTIAITGFNPFIPLDDVASGIPCAILEYTLRNPTQQPVDYQFSYHLSHLPQRGAEMQARAAALPGLGVHYWNDADPASAAFGSAALGILAGQPLVKARWLRGGWFDAISSLWREISSGHFSPNDNLAPDGHLSRHGGSVWVAGCLPPGGSVTYPVVIAWHFPNIVDPNCKPGECNCQSTWHPYYTTQWRDAREVLLYVRSHYADLRHRTQAFHDALFSSSLPPEVLEAISANLAVIKSPTVLRNANGDLWGWEGCFCDSGCCPGSCTHVWNYAQSIPHLFPALERTLREQEFRRSMDDRGHINFRAPLPGRDAGHDFHAAADGQLGGILKTYREWQISGDRAWLARIYPLAKRSLDFCIEQWDPSRVGLVEEPHHNTYDIEFWGPDGLGSSFYIAALWAMAELARDAGCPDDVAPYEALARRGAQAIDERLFNGEYYRQQVMTSGLRDTSFNDMLAGWSEPLTDEQRVLRDEGPRYQCGSGCLADGVWGAWLASLCGIKTPQKNEPVRSHLRAVYAHNFKPSLWRHANPQRPGYALGDEGGLLLCTWPRGEKPTLPFVYSDEVWTGIEYQVASHLVVEGMVDEGLAIVQATRARYNGRARNPWNEYECGSFYARAMASYALLIAFSGFRYSAATRALTLAPKLNHAPFRCFFSTATGWGVLTLFESWLEIDLKEGELAVDTLSLERDGNTLCLTPQVTARAGKTMRIALS